MTPTSDILIIGGGIVGLATAYHLRQKLPTRSLVVLEKESALAEHQTGRNSGVLHSGIYYKPGSRKATNCRTGRAAMLEFCRAEGVAHEICGKVIVATSEAESERLEALFERGKANGVQCALIDRDRLRGLEPHCAGFRAIHVAESGIVDYRQVCSRLAARVREHGHEIVLGTRVLRLDARPSEVIVSTDRGDYVTRLVVNCAGLHSDRVRAMSGRAASVKIIPFRGEYFDVTASARHLCQNLIYPVPDPQFPFLGVHFTRMIAGSVECGPNAVLALAREGYRKTDLSLPDLFEVLGYRGFRKLAARHWRMGVEEYWRSISKPAFVRALQRLIPDIRGEHLTPAPAGIRAQAVAPDGSLVDDFAIEEEEQMIHVVNAPSPPPPPPSASDSTLPNGWLTGPSPVRTKDAG